MENANCFADPKLGSISSLRCQKSRMARPGEDFTCEVMFRGRWSSVQQQPVFALRAATRQPSPHPARRAEAGAASKGWWSQTGSNRRPHACKARALPAELWPRILLKQPAPFALWATPASFTRLSRMATPREANGEAWWAWEDLNFRPHAYQARALTN